MPNEGNLAHRDAQSRTRILHRLRRLLTPRRLVALATLAGMVAWGCVPPPFDRTDGVPRTVARANDAFVVIGDTQQFHVVEWFAEGGAKQRGLVRDRIRALDPDLFLLAGDVVGEGFWKPYWNQFRREYAEFTIHPVPGNHDLHGPNRFGLNWYFTTFPHLERRRWYEVRYGPIAFLMLDSNRGEMSADAWRAQLAWLDARLDAAEADASVRLVACVTHHPPLSTSRGGGSRHVRDEFYARAARRTKFRLFFSGHHHAYQHIQDGERHLFVTGGGGAPQFYRRGGALPEGAELNRAAKVHHLMRGALTEDGVRIEMHELRPDGSWAVAETVDVPF